MDYSITQQPRFLKLIKNCGLRPELRPKLFEEYSYDATEYEDKLIEIMDKGENIAETSNDEIKELVIDRLMLLNRDETANLVDFLPEAIYYMIYEHLYPDMELLEKQD